MITNNHMPTIYWKIFLAVGILITIWGVLGTVIEAEPDGDADRADQSRAVSFLLTLAFLGFGIWALRTSGDSSGLLLAAFGLCYAMANFKGPGLGFPGGAIEFVQNRLSLFYTALLAHFLLVFPKPKAIFSKRVAVYLLYLPFVILVVYGLIVRNDQSSYGNGYNLGAAVTDLFYMTVALTAMIHSWFSRARIERYNSGLHWIAFGLAVAIVPFIILALARIVVPEFSLPGERHLPIVGIGIPAGLALAV